MVLLTRLGLLGRVIVLLLGTGITQLAAQSRLHSHCAGLT
jgi:hypothetical protein